MLLNRMLLVRVALSLCIVSSVSGGLYLAQLLQQRGAYLLVWFSSAFMTLLWAPVLLWFRMHPPSLPHALRTKHWTLVGLGAAAAVFAVLWLLANYLFVLGLALAPPSSTLALEQCATVWVALASAVVLRKWPTLAATLCALTVVAGVVVVALGDHFGPQQPPSTGLNTTQPSQALGDGLVVASTLCTAAFMVGSARYLAALRDMPLLLAFLALVGSWVAVLGWVPLPILNAAGAEPWITPSAAGWALLAANAATGLLFNVALNYAIVNVSPLFARLCVASAIPITFVIDLLVTGVFNYIRLIGSLLIGGGFVGYSVLDALQSPPAPAPDGAHDPILAPMQ